MSPLPGANNTPPEIGRIHSERVIPLLGRSFPTKRKIAEILKNSNDEYHRLENEGEWNQDDERFILAMLDGDNLVIIDAGGMTAKAIDNWSGFGVESDESTGEGEQGIGAKASMRQLCDNGAFLFSSSAGRLNVAAFHQNETNDQILTLPQWVHSKSCGCNGRAFKPEDGSNSNQYGQLESGQWAWNCEALYRYEEEDIDPVASLLRESAACGINLEREWEDTFVKKADLARQTFLDIVRNRGGWTLIHINGIQGRAQIPTTLRPRFRAIDRLKSELCSEAQVRNTLNESEVFFVDGNQADLLQTNYPEVMPGIESLVVDIEGPLVHPDTGEEIELIGPLQLKLNASSVAMTSPAFSSLRGVRVHDGRNTVWTHSIPQGSDPGAALHIWGEAVVVTKEDILRERADAGREFEPECVESTAINHVIDPYIANFQDQIAAILGTRTRTPHNADELQNDLDELMNQLENLVDIDSLFDGDDSGGTRPPAQAVTEIILENRFNPLNKVNMVKDVTHRLNIIALGQTPYGLAQLEQLHGIRGNEREPFFEIQSDNSAVVKVGSGFSIEAVSPGTANITVSASSLLNGKASTTLAIEVIEIAAQPVVNLNPTPGPRGAEIEIEIEAVSSTGETVTHKDTMFTITVSGTGSLINKHPCKLKTSIEKGTGKVTVTWAHLQTAEVDFVTTDELYVRNSRKNDGNDGSDSRKFPKLVLCGQTPYSRDELSGLGLNPDEPTIEPSPSLPTLVYDPLWHDEASVVWLNTSSSEALAMLASNHHSQGIVNPSSQVYKRWRWGQIAEVAIRQIMDEEIRRGLRVFPTILTQIWEAHNSAKTRLGGLYTVLASGSFEELNEG